MAETPRKRPRLSKSPSPSPRSAQSPSNKIRRIDTATLNPADAEKDRERGLGISAFVSTAVPGFSGVFKQRYTDFLVNEITPNGEVLHLRDLDAPKFAKPETQNANVVENPEKSVGSDATSNGNAAEVAAEANGNGPGPAPAASDEVATQEEKPSAGIKEEDRVELVGIFGEETAEEVIRLHEEIIRHPNRKTNQFMSVFSSKLKDRDLRTQAHQAIRRVFASKVDTKTVDGDRIEFRAATAAGKSGNRKAARDDPSASSGLRGKPAWDTIGGEHLHFTIFKQNKDTMEVMGLIGKMSGVNGKRFRFAGTKDRRAVTVQRASGYRVSADRLASLSGRLYGVTLGDFKYEQQQIELGDLTGNEFTITLRDCNFPGEQGLPVEERVQLAERIVSKAADDYRQNGFINYYGPQRFGSYDTGTHMIGISILKGDFEGAVKGILSVDPDVMRASQGKAPKGNLATDDLARADAIFTWNTTKDSKQALKRLPRRFSGEHEVINYLGRKAQGGGLAEQRNDWFGALAHIPRNLRLLYVHAYQSWVWNKAATKRWELYGAKVVEGDLVIVEQDEASKKPKGAQYDDQGELIVEVAADDRAAHAEESYERARPLTNEEADSGRYTIFDIVLPQPGYDVEYPKNESGEYYKTFMGSAEGGRLNPHDMRRKQKDYSLSGSYRTLMGQANQDMEYKVVAYSDDNKQLVETDLDVLRRLGKAPRSEPPSKTEPGSNDDIPLEGVKGKVDEKKADKIGVVLKFQLSTSQYATMALRELLKDGTLKYQPEFGNR